MASQPLKGVRVGLDARSQPAGPATGVERYRLMLRQTLEALGAEVWALTDARPGEGRASRLERWLRAAGAAVRDLRRVEGEPAWLRSDVFREAQVFFNLHGRLLPVQAVEPPHVMHWSYPLPLRMAGARNVYTVHDLIPLSAPRLSPLPERRHRRLLARIAEDANHIVTVSQSSRDELCSRLGLPQARVSNTYQAVDTSAVAPDLPAGLLPRRYLLVCGSVEPRKNIARIIAAHSRRPGAPPLVIAGPDGWRARAQLAGAGEGVIRLPWQDRPTLLALVREARALVFPSLAEGFGLPVLEAMSLGAPVITSNEGALAEIAGDAALRVDPQDVAAIAAAIGAVTQDAGLWTRLSRAGRDRARDFSADAYAARLADAYRTILAAPPR